MASSPNASFRLCTYNMGASPDDYYKLYQFVNPGYKFTSQADQDKLIERYVAAQERVADLLFNQAEVYFLQETQKLNRPLLKTLQDHHFRIFTTDSNVKDPMIVLHKDFDGENLPKVLDGGDVAIAKAVHKPSGKAFTFVSARVKGCNLEGKVDPREAKVGDDFCSEIASILDTIGVGTIQIIGLDMNANPEKWPARFEHFTKKGFEIIRTNAPTNVMPLSDNYKEREIDFFLVRKPSKSRLASLLSMVKTPPANKVTITKSQLLGFNVETNASDHIPIFAMYSLNG